MTKRQIVLGGVIAWVAIHGGLFAAGALFGGGIEALTHPFDSDRDSDTVQCQEDEVAIHGGLANWYDPDLPLACVNFDEFPELHPFDYEQWRAETYRDGFMEGYNEGLSDAANTEIGEAWSKPPAPEPTPTPAPISTPTPTPEPEVNHTVMTVSLTFYICPPFCLGMPMYNGAPLHVRAVACGWALQDGQVFEFDGQTYTCEDRGSSVNAYWIDFWMPDHATGQAWQARVGQVGEIVLVQ
jgi:hypothetical protein